MSSFLTNIFASVGKVLGAANKIDADIQSVESIAESELGKTAAQIVTYEAGGAVVLGPISEGGHTGKVYAIADNSPIVPMLAGRTEIPLS